MTQLFLTVVNLSITAGWIVIAILLLRPLLRKAPKWIYCLLWGVVALRLAVPFSMESVFSLLPSARVIPTDIATAQTPAIESGIPILNEAINPLFVAELAPERGLLEQILELAPLVWLAGVGGMLLYYLISRQLLRRRVRTAVRQSGNVYVCDDVDSPFLFGMLRPRIYLPSGMDWEQQQYVLAHEQAHLKRKDHWWKPIGFLLLSIYWFNPLLWLAYSLLSRDIEQACDEKVIAKMDSTAKRGYSEALVACSIHRKRIVACPVAFGEVGLKTRIRGIVRYKKPAFWLILAALAVCVGVCVCFLTVPEACPHLYETQVTMSATCHTPGTESRTCRLCGHTYSRRTDLCPHVYDEGTVILAPDCFHNGSIVYRCTGCTDIEIRTLSHLEHIPGDTVLVTQADCTHPGEEAIRCALCGTIYDSREIPVNDVHQMQLTVTKTATCQRRGKGYQTCLKCGLQEDVVIPKKEHDFAPWCTHSPNCQHHGEYIEACTYCMEARVTWLPKDPKNHYKPNDGWCGYCRVRFAESKNTTSTTYDSGELFVTKNQTGILPQLPVVSIEPNVSPKPEFPDFPMANRGWG